MRNVIYQIKNLVNNNKYIGSAVGFKARKREHLHLLNNNKHHSFYLQKSYNKYGSDNFVFTILEQNLKKRDLIEREQFYIDLINPHYNMCKVAGSRLGTTVSEETKEKLRKRMEGKKIHTKKSRAAIRKSQLGNTHSSGSRNSLKVTNEIYIKILSLRAEGLGCRKIAKIIKLNKTTILNVFNDKYNYGRDQ